MYNSIEANQLRANIVNNSEVDRVTIEDVLDRLINNYEDIGAFKLLKSLSIKETIPNPYGFLQKLITVREKMSTFKKSVLEIERLIKELKNVVIREYEEQKNKISILDLQKKHLQEDIQITELKINHITEEIVLMGRVLSGELNFVIQSSDNEDYDGYESAHANYEVNIKSGACSKVSIDVCWTEFKGWDREEVSVGKEIKLKELSSALAPLNLAVTLSGLDDNKILSQDQRSTVIERLKLKIKTLNKEEYELSDKIKQNQFKIQLIDEEIKSLKEKLNTTRLLNKAMFPELYAVKIRKKSIEL